VIYGVARSRLNYFESSSFSPESGKGKGGGGRSQSLRLQIIGKLRRSLGSLRFILGTRARFDTCRLVPRVAHEATNFRFSSKHGSESRHLRVQQRDFRFPRCSRLTRALRALTRFSNYATAAVAEKLSLINSDVR